VDLGYNEVSQRYNQHNIAYTRQHSKLDGLKQELRFRTNQLTELRKQISTNTEQLGILATQIKEVQDKYAENELELGKIMASKDAEEKGLNVTDQAFYRFRSELGAREGALNLKRREKEHAEVILSGLKEQLNAMKLQVAGMKERLNVEFRINLDDILDEPRKDNASLDELTAEADKLKKRLENMGEINPTAIEAYSEIKVRHDFITLQRNDLMQARESLRKTIEEVELTANTRFNDTFNQVRENFVQVFKALFTDEDNCDLRLTEPDNLAESNIEIYAQPKGKKPSTLTQLSGGEKTLTSTAFLFAIYLIKPAPFCILDEVDAPLDDANVGKFTQMIRKFSDNSQFIIVTHNKQTMASVDVIYGVTMQEAGVSKLVPVDFRSLN
jgi:chromosome segregation protein